jgi:hypothetical protein
MVHLLGENPGEKCHAGRNILALAGKRVTSSFFGICAELKYTLNRRRIARGFFARGFSRESCNGPEGEKELEKEAGAQLKLADTEPLCTGTTCHPPTG